MEEEIEFGPFEATIHHVVSLIERASERILALNDLGFKGIEPQEEGRTMEAFKDCIICHMTAKAARPNIEQLKNLANRIDHMSAVLPSIGKHGKKLAEEMNLAGSSIRRMIMEGVDEKGEPLP